MDEIESIEARRKQIIKEISEIRAMRKGSVIDQYLKVRKAGQKEPEIIGPYPLYTCKDKGRTVGRRLTPKQADRYRKEVEAFHSFQALCQEFATLTERLGDLENELGGEAREKNSGNYL